MQHEQGCNGVEISCWRWRPGRDYQGGSLENEVILSKDEGTGKILYSKADPPLGYVSWKGVSVPEQRHEYPVGVTGTVTGFGVESFFPARRGIFDTQFCKRIWKRTVHLPPSSSYKFKVFIPRIWPVFEEDVTALQYLMKNKIERVLRFRWHSLCGLVPVADETKDPVASDIHTEKMILAMRKCTKVSAVRYLSRLSRFVWTIVSTSTILCLSVDLRIELLRSRCIRMPRKSQECQVKLKRSHLFEFALNWCRVAINFN